MVNPFKWNLDQVFPARAGTDMRVYRYFCQYVAVSALMRAGDRPRFEVGGNVSAVVACWDDVTRAAALVGDKLTALTKDKMDFLQRWSSRRSAQGILRGGLCLDEFALPSLRS